MTPDHGPNLRGHWEPTGGWYDATDLDHPLRPDHPAIPIKAPRSIDRIPLPPQADEVYVIRAGPRVKIGFTTRLYQRLATLQGQSPFKLELISAFPGTVADERALHRRFASCRVHGEWFEPDAEMQAWLDGLAP